MGILILILCGFYLFRKTKKIWKTYLASNPS